MQDLTARRTNAETTDSIRLQTALQKKRCRHCGQAGTAWTVYKTDGGLRYLKCRGCGRNDQIVVPRTSGAAVEADADATAGGPEPQEVA